MVHRIRSVVLVALSLALLGVAMYAIVHATGQEYTYGRPGSLDAKINGSGSKLYVPYGNDGYIVEIDTNTMLELRRFLVPNPAYIYLDDDETYLYAISCQWPDRIYRIQLSDGDSTYLTLEGRLGDLALDSQGGRLWAVHFVWPEPDEMTHALDAPSHPDTGRLSEISLGDFQVSRSMVIEAVPTSVWYSPYSEKVYVAHQLRRFIHDDAYEHGGWDSFEVIGNPITIYGLDQERLYLIGEVFGGHHDSFLYIPYHLGAWDDEGRYLVAPSPITGRPDFSLRVIDTVDDSVEFDLQFPSYYEGQLVTAKYVQKVPGDDVLWVAIRLGVLYPDFPGEDGVVVRVNTLTLEHDVFVIENVGSRFGDFAVSPDGDTLYLTAPSAGRVIVWSPPD